MLRLGFFLRSLVSFSILPVWMLSIGIAVFARPVRFERAVRSAGEQGYRVFVESSPHPVLSAGIEEFGQLWPM